MLAATFAAPPRRYSSRSNCTTGTGASGEIRVDPAEDEVVEHQVADDEDGPAGDPVEQRVESGHRQAACDGWRTRRRRCRRAIGGVGERHEQQEEHQELGIAEIVFEHAGGEHRDDAGQRRGGQRTAAATIGSSARSRAAARR